MNDKRSDHTAYVLPNGQLLVTGGITDGRETLDSAELYRSFCTN
jgi:hypothetical protein